MYPLAIRDSVTIISRKAPRTIKCGATICQMDVEKVFHFSTLNKRKVVAFVLSGSLTYISCPLTIFNVKCLIIVIFVK